MKVDRRARPWIVVCLLLFLAATAAYIPYARGPRGPHGGSLLGLIYGIAGSAMILFALILGLRRRFRTARLGRALTWMEGHVWLGLLSYPLILFHAGFAWGGLLTQVLMWMFTLVVITGVIGLIFQQYIPATILRDVPAETIFEQIPRVLNLLREQAERIVAGVRERAAEPQLLTLASTTGGVSYAADAGGPAVMRPSGSSAVLLRFYETEIVPFLRETPTKSGALATAAKAATTFQRIRLSLSDDLRPDVEDLMAIVEERRQLEHQRRLHLWLHTWLLIHVPLSYAMGVLAVLHALGAWRYATTG